MAEGRLEFDRSSFRARDGREGLLGPAEGRPWVYGVKSFEHAINHLAERCNQVLDLVPAFDHRHIRTNAGWETQLYPKLRDVLLDAAKTQPRRLRLALAAGSVLDIKSGPHIEPASGSVSEICWSRAASIPASSACRRCISSLSLAIFSPSRVVFIDRAGEGSCRSALSSCSR